MHPHKGIVLSDPAELDELRDQVGLFSHHLPKDDSLCAYKEITCVLDASYASIDSSVRETTEKCLACKAKLSFLLDQQLYSPSTVETARFLKFANSVPEITNKRIPIMEGSIDALRRELTAMYSASVSAINTDVPNTKIINPDTLVEFLDELGAIESNAALFFGKKYRALVWIKGVNAKSFLVNECFQVTFYSPSKVVALEGRGNKPLRIAPMDHERIINSCVDFEFEIVSRTNSQPFAVFFIDFFYGYKHLSRLTVGKKVLRR